MTNHHTKLEDPWAMSSLVTEPMDRPTCAKQYTPILFKGGHNYLQLRTIFIDHTVINNTVSELKHNIMAKKT